MNSRAKGADAERELARVIRDHLGVRMVRNLEQYRRGGHDLVPHEDETGPVAAVLGRYAIEAKRYAKASQHLLKGWWAETCVQAERVGLLPCLCYREDGRTGGWCCPWLRCGRTCRRRREWIGP
jgi:hypothetical protein